MTLLAVRGLCAVHGLLQAVRSVDLDLAEGEILALVGANGAGKTTLLRTIAGVHAPVAGRVEFDGADITNCAPHERVARGIALVPEGRRLFLNLTVEENLRVGAVGGRKGGWDLDRVLHAFPLLRPLRKVKATHLSGGEQQATAIGRALMANPRLLLLDELSLGLSPKAIDGVYASLRTLSLAQTAIILVEQDLQRGLSFAGRVVCLLEGQIVAQGRADELTREQVMQHYFGTRLPAVGAMTA
ncbi:MAG TPA: ABC transporter ATP-binding protein [Burkholderiaceae bacterium]|nr:ABC transporter ATP-binding protein [Burkholderiaceae bacterium]